MEALGVPSTFRFPLFLPNKLAFRRLPLPPTAFRSLSRPYLSRTPPPQRHGNRRLAVPCAADPAPPAAPNEDEAGAILRGFLEEHGMRSALEERRALVMVDLLSSKLRFLHESEQKLGIQLNVPQLVDVFTPYLRLLLDEYGGDIRTTGEDGQLPSAPPGWEKTGAGITVWFIKKRKAIAQLEMQLLEGCPPSHVLYMMNLGLNLRQIRSMVRKFPALADPTVKQKLDRMVEFLISIGVPESELPRILRKCPLLLPLKIKENIMPSMALLESKGVDKAQWPKILRRFPGMLMVSKAKVEAFVEYFSEMGLSDTAIGRLLTRNPMALGNSLEAKIKPADRFLLARGFSMEDVNDIILAVNIYGVNLEQNLKPKWDFFLTTTYTRSDLLKYPSYFGYSLEKRIKPRYELMAKLGIRWDLKRLLSHSNAIFESYIKSARARINTLNKELLVDMETVERAAG